MQLQSIAIKNYKGIDEINIGINGKNTVIFGTNGAGKSSVLSAVSCVLSRIIVSLSDGVFNPTDTLSVSDIKYGETKTDISCVFSFSESQKKRFTLSRHISKTGKPQKYTDISDFYEALKTYKDVDGNLPVLVHYGVNRNVWSIPLRVHKNHSFESISAYENAIENKIDFKSFFIWFRNREDHERKIIEETKNSSYKDKSLECVRTAVSCMLEGFCDLRVRRNPLRMTVNKNDAVLTLQQLSDGEKIILALTGDLARRTALANPNLDNPLLGGGIVLIDEIELHMHTTWQRKIINKLTQLFPNLQFIITTHSPQVLGELDEDINIFLVNKTETGFQTEKYKSLIAWDVNSILEDLMNTPSLNRHTKAIIDEMYQCIQDKKFDKASELADKIDTLSGGMSEDAVRGRTLIRRGLSRI